MARYVVKKNSNLMDFLLIHYGRKQAKLYLKYQEVYINNDNHCKFDTLVKENDVIEIKKTSNNNGLDIIYEDKEFVVINKPAGLLSMSDGNEKENTAYHKVSEYVKSQNKNNRIFIVHRLDRETSGVLMFAKNEKIKNILQDNWNNIVEKRGYLAIVEGRLKKNHGVIKNYLDENKTHQVYVSNNGTGKLAITNYKVLKENRNNSLVEVFLDTGRKNQIRVHMQYLNHSIVGDKKYGATSNPIKRLGLHAHVFSFTHPNTKAKMEFKAAVPMEFKKMFN